MFAFFSPFFSDYIFIGSPFLIRKSYVYIKRKKNAPVSREENFAVSKTLTNPGFMKRILIFALLLNEN